MNQKLSIFEPLFDPSKNPKCAHISASRMKFRNRLGAFSNLAIMSMHAKFQLIWAIRLARAMGVVRKLTSHLIFGGNL